jgi:ABC-type Na+ transport system ATPase subunit NatA
MPHTVLNGSCSRAVKLCPIGSVFLDEPSTGLDPASRRGLWDVVRSNKAGRGLLLTTHSMEEAQVGRLTVTQMLLFGLLYDAACGTLCAATRPGAVCC